ncbi:MAG: radical SAM family heme chaperone HemW [Nitrospiria bacterium]
MSYPTPPSPADLGVYVHIPFCLSKCSYCAFSSVQSERNLMSRYLDDVEREIDWHMQRGTCEGRRARSLYFGGGTPSLTPPARLARLIARCRTAWGLAEDAEITLEVNPETASLGAFRAWGEAGVNRISLGVQSLDSDELLDLRRPHTPRRVIEACEQARRARCPNLSVDLIYGIPGQPSERWRATVRGILSLGPDHLSAYALTPEPGTPFGAAVEEGRVLLPPDDLILEQEQILEEEITAAGLRRYEISNYARPGYECRHNLLYWRGDDWLGLGASAHSRIGERRWWNRFDPTEYLDHSPEEWMAGEERLDARQRMGEALAVGVRLIGGVDRHRITRLLGIDPWTSHRAALNSLSRAGLLEPDLDVVRLTPQGLMFADHVGETLVS